MEPHFGWLEKKSGGKEEQEASKKKSVGQRRGKWDRRYFVVIPAGDNKGQMMYFKGDADWQKYGANRLSCACLVRHTRAPALRHAAGPAAAPSLSRQLRRPCR